MTRAAQASSAIQQENVDETVAKFVPPTDVDSDRLHLSTLVLNPSPINYLI